MAVMVVLLLLAGALAVASSMARGAPGLAGSPGDVVAAAAPTTSPSYPSITAPVGTPLPLPGVCQRAGELGLVHRVAFGGGEWFWFLDWQRTDGALHAFEWTSTIPTDLWVAGEHTGEHHETGGASSGTFELPTYTRSGRVSYDTITAVAFCPSTYESGSN